MAALQFVIQKLDADKRGDLSPLVDELEEMNDLLAEYLNNEK
jgi:cell division protein ZapA